MRVPVHQGCKVDVHIESERKRLFVEVAVFQKLVDLTELKLDSLFRQAQGGVTQTDQMAIPDGHVIHNANESKQRHHVIDDVVETGCEAVEHFIINIIIMNRRSKDNDSRNAQSKEDLSTEAKAAKL